MYGSQTQMNNTNVHEGNDAGRYPILTVTPAAHSDANQLSQDIAKIQLEQVIMKSKFFLFPIFSTYYSLQNLH